MKLAIALLLVSALVVVQGQQENNKKQNKKGCSMRKVLALVYKACPEIERCQIPNMPVSGKVDRTCKRCLKRCVKSESPEVARELHKCMGGVRKLPECQEAKKCGQTCFQDNDGDREGLIACFSADCCDTFATCHEAKCDKKAECLAPADTVAAITACAETAACQEVCGGAE